MLIGTSPGLPGEYLLVFTLLLWLLFFLIYLVNPGNRMNRWCFIGDMIYSLGVLKEYLYFSLVPCLLFGCFYPYAQTRHYQLFDHTYYLLVSAYKLHYGVAFTVLVLKTLISERKQPVSGKRCRLPFCFSCRPGTG